MMVIIKKKRNSDHLITIKSLSRVGQQRKKQTSRQQQKEKQNVQNAVGRRSGCFPKRILELKIIIAAFK